LIKFQINLVPPQYNISKAFNLLLYPVVVSAESYFIIMDMFFILGTLAQVGAHSKVKEKPLTELLDVLLLGHHLKRSARSLKPRPNPYQVRVHLGLQDQHAVKRTPRTRSDFVFDDPHMDGKIIS